MGEIVGYENRFRVQKVSITGRSSSEKLSRESEKILRSAKRVLLIFTQDFVEDEFKSRSFLVLLKELSLDDSNCVVIAINKGLDKKLFDYCVDYLDSPTRDSRSFERSGYYEKMSVCSRLAANVKYHCGLRNVERLDYLADDFRKYFTYTLPMLALEEKKTCRPRKSKPQVYYYRKNLRVSF